MFFLALLENTEKTNRGVVWVVRVIFTRTGSVGVIRVIFTLIRSFIRVIQGVYVLWVIFECCSSLVWLQG